MHRCRHAGSIRIPGKDIERRRILAEVPVVDDVAPDHILRAHPVERASHLIRLGESRARSIVSSSRAIVASSVNTPNSPRLAEVDERVGYGRARNPLAFAAGRKVREQDQAPAYRPGHSAARFVRLRPVMRSTAPSAATKPSRR